jgi:hypothetical protein
LRRALAEARSFSDGSPRARSLAVLALSLPEQEAETVSEEALEAVRTIAVELFRLSRRIEVGDEVAELVLRQRREWVCFGAPHRIIGSCGQYL